MKIGIFNTFFFSSLLLFTSIGHSQNKIIDSLQKTLQNQKEDTSRVNTLNTLSFNVLRFDVDFEKAMRYAHEAMRLAEKIGYQKGIGKAHQAVGNVYSGQVKYPEALQFYYRALKFFEQDEDVKDEASLYVLIGRIYGEQGKFTESRKYLLAALKIQREIGDKKSTAYLYADMADILEKEENYSEALKQFFYEKEGLLAVSSGNEDAGKNKYREAMQYYIRALTIWQESDSKINISDAYIHLANVYSHLNNISEAKRCLQHSLSIATEIQSKEQFKKYYQSLSRLDSLEGNYQQAYSHFKRYIAYRDSLVNEGTTKKSLQITMQYESDKKEALSRVEQVKKMLNRAASGIGNIFY